MTIEGANNFYEATDYIVYTMNSGTTGPYCAIIPKNVTNTLNMLIELHMKKTFDSLTSGTKTREELIEELNKEYNTLKTTYSSCMLVIPMIDENILESAINNGEKQKMFDEVKKISAITSDLYKKLTDSGVEKQKIDQKIIIVEKNSEDEKFVAWLKEQMPNFVDSIAYKVETQPTNANPFMSGDIFQNVQNEVPATPTPAPTSTPAAPTSIFDNIAPPQSTTPDLPQEPITAAPVGPTEPVAPEVPVANVDIFGIPTDTAAAAPVAQPVQASVTPEPTVVPTPNPIPEQAPVAPEQPAPAVNNNLENTTIVNPQPVQSVGLEGTTTFSPIPEQAPVAPEQPTEELVEEKKNNRGFVNLAILLIVLVGVTIFSIELGKFLYDVYGG